MAMMGMFGWSSGIYRGIPALRQSPSSEPGHAAFAAYVGQVLGNRLARLWDGPWENLNFRYLYAGVSSRWKWGCNPDEPDSPRGTNSDAWA